MTIPDELVMNKICIIRGQKVILDHDLAELYQLKRKRLIKLVTKNTYRFSEDFMFRLNQEEYEILMPQFASSNWEGYRKLPLAFTEQGIGVLSGLLNNKKTIWVNIQIILLFTRMRNLSPPSKDIFIQLEKMEKKLARHDEDIALIFEYI